MSKPENKKSLLHKINDVFEDYVVSKLGDIDVLEAVENLPENSLGSDFNGPASICYATNRPSEAAQRIAAEEEDIAEELVEQAVSSIGQAPDGWTATPLPERRADEDGGDWEDLRRTAGAELSADAGEQPAPIAVNAGTVSEEEAIPAGEFDSRAQQPSEGLTKGQRPNTREKSVPPSDSNGPAVRRAEDSTEERMPAPESPQMPQETPCRPEQGNTCPEDFDALWSELACLRAGFTELMAIAYYKDVGSLREMQQRIRGMQLILQAIAERNGYTPPEVPGECNLPREYGYALRVMRARVLQLYDCIMGIVLRSKADYDMVALCMTLMRIATTLRELN